METRTLGAKLEVSAIGFGCVSMSGIYGAVTDAEATATIAHACDLGITFFDTADVYGGGDNERLVGRALRDYRNQVIIATKGGLVNAAQPETICGRPEYLKRCCDDSLQRLGTDWIDLYYLHRIDPMVPIEESIGAMGELVAAGKVRYLGLCEPSARSVRRAAATHVIAAVQSEWSLWTRDVEDEVLNATTQLGIGVVAYCPLGRGFLAGAVNSPNDLDSDDYRRGNPRFGKRNFSQNRRLLDRIVSLATVKGCTPAQLAIAWLLAQGDHIVPIPGTRRIAHLEENVGAATVQLTEHDLTQLDVIVPKGVAAGARYGDARYAYGDSPEITSTA